MSKKTIKAVLQDGDPNKDVVVAVWDGEKWSGDSAFTSSSTEQQIIDEQWSWNALEELLDEGEISGWFEIADSGVWSWWIIEESEE